MDTAATERERALEQRVNELERENALLKNTPPAPPAAPKRKTRCILDDSDSDSDGGEAAVPVTQSPRPRKKPKSNPLADEDAARVAQTAFIDWYDELYSAAEDEGRISIDDSVFGEAPAPAPVRVPAGGHGG